MPGQKKSAKRTSRGAGRTRKRPAQRNPRPTPKPKAAAPSDEESAPDNDVVATPTVRVTRSMVRVPPTAESQDDHGGAKVAAGGAPSDPGRDSSEHKTGEDTAEEDDSSPEEVSTPPGTPEPRVTSSLGRPRVAPEPPTEFKVAESSSAKSAFTSGASSDLDSLGLGEYVTGDHVEGRLEVFPAETSAETIDAHVVPWSRFDQVAGRVVLTPEAPNGLDELVLIVDAIPRAVWWSLSGRTLYSFLRVVRKASKVKLKLSHSVGTDYTVGLDESKRLQALLVLAHEGVVPSAVLDDGESGLSDNDEEWATARDGTTPRSAVNSAKETAKDLDAAWLDALPTYQHSGSNDQQAAGQRASFVRRLMKDYPGKPSDDVLTSMVNFAAGRHPRSKCPPRLASALLKRLQHGKLISEVDLASPAVELNRSTDRVGSSRGSGGTLAADVQRALDKISNGQRVEASLGEIRRLLGTRQAEIPQLPLKLIQFVLLAASRTRRERETVPPLTRPEALVHDLKVWIGDKPALAPRTLKLRPPLVSKQAWADVGATAARAPLRHRPREPKNALDVFLDEHGFRLPGAPADWRELSAVMPAHCRALAQEQLKHASPGVLRSLHGVLAGRTPDDAWETGELLVQP